MLTTQSFGTLLLNLALRVACASGFVVALTSCSTVANPQQAAAAPAAPQTIDAAPQTDAIQFPEEPTRSRVQDRLREGQALQIINEFGEIRVRFGGYVHQLEATAVAQAPIGSAIPEMRYDAERAEIRTALPTADALVAGQRIDVTVFVPEGHALNVRSLQGLIEVRGLRADLQARSESGSIFVRGVTGALDLQTGSGSIEAALSEQPVKSAQRIETRTGPISVSFAPEYSAQLALATSGLFATEYSIEVAPLPGQEPNKSARALLGTKPQSDASSNLIQIQSKRGDIRLFRRAAFVDVDLQ